VRTKELAKKLENLRQSVSLKHSIVVLTELRSAERFLTNVRIYADVQGVVCFYRNCQFLIVSVGFISLHKTQTSRFVTVLVAKKEA
jgi:hypothetical protein